MSNINTQTTHQNLEIYAGTSKTYELEFTKNNHVVDITGWTVYFTAKQKIGDLDANAVISKDITTHTDANNGETEIELTTTDTDITPGKYYYDIKYLDDDGNSDILFTGILTIKKPVTTR